MDWRPVQGDPASHPMTAGIGSSPPRDPELDQAVIENGWLVVSFILLKQN